jgi:hypothetical protein
MVHRKWGRADGEGSAVLARSPELFFLKKKKRRNARSENFK